MHICVFCSAQQVDEKYGQASAEFARLLAQKGHTLVWGGSDVGLMNVIATAAQEAGGKIVGVSVDYFKQKARKNADEMIFAPDLAERKKMMMGRADAYVALVGGTGTLDEILEMIELKKYEVHAKPVVILNTDGFYVGLKTQFQRMNDEGFLMFPLQSIVHFADTPEDALKYITEYGG